MCLQTEPSSSSLACRNEAKVIAESGSSDPPLKRSPGSALISFCYQHMGTNPCPAPDHLTALLPLWQDSCSRAFPNIPAVLHGWWKSQAKQNILGQLKLLTTVKTLNKGVNSWISSSWIHRFLLPLIISNDLNHKNVV